MADAMRISNYQRPVTLLEVAQRDRAAKPTKAGKQSFQELFSREVAADRSVHFSKHASERLFSRRITLDANTLERIADAIDKADSKGSKETLILADEAALVVSVRNRTVVTVFDRSNLRDGIVTSIDSAVIM